MGIVVEGTEFQIYKFEVTGNEDKQYIAQYMFYGRGGGYGYLKIEADDGHIMAENIVHLGLDDTFASSVTTGYFKFEQHNKSLIVHLAYIDNCDCQFPSSGEIVYGVSTMPPSNTFTLSAGYDTKLKDEQNYDDAIVIITFTEKKKEDVFFT